VHELIEIPGPGPNDPGGRQLAAVVNAQRCAEDWTARRVFYGRVVVVLSAALAYIQLRRLDVTSPTARLVLALWVLAFGSLIASLGAAWRAERRVDHLVARAGGRRVGITERD
jgi:hypothetical protein